MTHNNHIIDGINKEINPEYPNRDAYLKMTEGFDTKLPPVIIEEVMGFQVAREDLLGHGGTKARAGEWLVSKIEEDTLVYSMPRVGHAPCAIVSLANLYNKRVVLFAPACKRITNHQAAAIELADKLDVPLKVKWRRIPAMPNLNRMGAKWAKENNAAWLPFGLNHPGTIAGFTRICQNLLEAGFEEPKEVWTVVSTGVLTRGLQIGFENADMRGVCVARNMKKGELGRTKIWSEPRGFTSRERKENLPPFDTVATYDGKGWKYMLEHGQPGALFWNVAGELDPSSEFDYSEGAIDSYREWGEVRD